MYLITIINSATWNFVKPSTENGGWTRGFARLAHVGQVGINIGTPAPITYFPVGGKKVSMFGDIRGRTNEAIDFYTDKKVIISRWHSSFHGVAKSLDDDFAMRNKYT